MLRPGQNLAGAGQLRPQPDHFTMGNTVLLVDGGSCSEPQLLIETLKILLGRYPNRDPGIKDGEPRQGLMHYRPAKPCAACCPDGQEPTDRRFPKSTFRGEHSEIGSKLSVIEVFSPAHEMQGTLIEAVCILIGAVLFDRENLLPDPQYFIELFPTEFVKCRPLP